MESAEKTGSGEKSIARLYKQWIATLGVFLLLLQIGINIGWSSPNLARLTNKNDSRISLTQDQASWIASLPGLGALVGSILGSSANALFGSRKTILLTLVVASIAWIHIIVANSYIWLYAARGISGIGLGATFSCFSLYLGEIASPELRGTFISIAAVGSPIGAVVSSTLEVYLEMDTSAYIYLGMCVTTIVLFFWLMDTPHYLVKKKDLKLAKKSIVFYDSQCDVDKQLDEITNFMKTDVNTSLRDKLKEINTPVVRKSMVIIIILFALPHLTGMPTITAYMETILTNGKSFLIDPKEFVIYANITGIVSSILTLNLIDKFGRRIMLVGTTIGTSLAMAALGTHFMLLKQEFDPQSIEWLPITAIIVFLITYAIGLTSVPSTVLSELFSDNIKSVAALIAPLSASLASFIMSKIYQPIVDAVGESYAFWLYAGLSLISIPTAIFMPETKGKTFQEIQDDLRGKKDKEEA